MKSGKLWLLFLTFTPKELKRFAKTLNSPIFNQEGAVLRLFNWMAKQKEKKAYRISEEKAFLYAYPEKDKYNSAAFHALKSRLLGIMEKFLQMEREEQLKITTEIDMLEIYRERNLSKHFEQKLKRIKKNKGKEGVRNSDFHYSSYRIEREIFEMQGRGNRTKETNLQTLNRQLNTFFILEKLKYAVVMESHKAVYKSEYEQPMLPFILELVKNDGFLEMPEMAIYFYCYQALKNPDDEENFNQLKLLIQKNNQLFSKNELKDIYTIANNYCVKRINNGAENYLQELFDLYISGLDAGVFLTSGVLSRWSYTNIVTAGLRLKEFEWLAKFIQEYKNILEEDFQESIYAYNLSRLYHVKKKYDEAMSLLIQVDLKDVLINISAKVLLTKIYFELEEFEALESLLASFKKYLRRNKVISYHKTNYSNFVYYTQKILQLNQFDKIKKQKLKEEVNQAEILTEREWILEQLK